MPTEKRRVIRAHIYFLADLLPLSLFLLPPSLPPTLPPPPLPTSASLRILRKQVSGDRRAGASPAPKNCPSLCAPFSQLEPSSRFQLVPHLLSPDRQHRYLPPHLHPRTKLLPFGLVVDAPGSRPKMAPRTLHTGPAAAQDPGQRRRGPGPGLYVSGVLKILAPSFCTGCGAGSLLPLK